MTTLEVTFNGKSYKVRNNQLTRRYWAEEVAANKTMDGLESVTRYGFCLLRGFNVGFTMTYLEYSMYIDDEKNTDFIKAITELIQELMDEYKDLVPDAETEKK